MELLIGLGALAVLGALGLLIPMLYRRVVPTNEVHIVQTGKETISYGRGTEKGNVYYKWPTWLPVIGVEVKSLSVAIFDVELDGYEAFDKGRLPFLVDVVAFFRISDYAMAAQKVASTENLVNHLNSIVQGAVRAIIAKADIEEIMEERSALGEKFTTEVKEQLKSWGVEAVKNIELMDIKDAPKSEIIHSIMAKKKSHIEMESRQEVAKNNKTAELTEVLSRQEVDLGKQDALQKVGLRTVEAEQLVEIATETKKQNVIEQTKLTTEREMEVTRIKSTKKAEIDKEVALTIANQQKEVAILEANKNKESGLIKAEAELQVKSKGAEADFNVKTKAAEADLVTKQNNAKGAEAEGLARAASEKALLLAPVEATIKLATEIGQNKEYQKYLLDLEQIKANQAVGEAQAAALQTADVKIISNAGSPNEGVKKVMDLFSSNGGTQIAALLEGLSQSETGKALLDKVLGKQE